MLFSIFGVFKLIVLLHYGNCQHDIDDACFIQSSHRDGVCRSFYRCIEAIEDIRRNIYPQICRFQGTEPIVCCAQSNGGSTRSTSTTTARTTTLPTTRPPQTFTGYGAKSRQKCMEYQQYVYQEDFSGLRVDSPQTVRRDRCALMFNENIAGKTEAEPKEFPHMARIGLNAENNETLWICGGALISDEFVMTTAHCLYIQRLGEPKYVRIGNFRLDTNHDDAQVQDFTIVEWIRHPEYIPPSIYNDIGLLRLNNKVRLNSYARPACLHTSLNIPVRKATASGWGGYMKGFSKNLLKVTLEFFSNYDCNSTYPNDIGRRLRNGIVESMHFCAGHHMDAKHICPGSGGPLQIINPDPKIYCMYSLVGISGFGRACGVANIPDLYTRVSNYIDWIEKIVWP